MVSLVLVTHSHVHTHRHARAHTPSSSLSPGSKKCYHGLSCISLYTYPVRYKGCLVGTVLDGYLSLKKLVVQRTKMIESSQDLLLGLLEQLTTGEKIIFVRS